MTLMETLRKEHDAIWQFTEQMEQQCLALMQEDVFDAQAFYKDVDYIRTYADAEHHKKEEDLLFRAMLDKLGPMAVNLIRHGMLVEHDQARLFVFELENAVKAYENKPTPSGKLEILTQAMGYVYLLRRHIEKENGAVYPFAERMLDAKTMEKLEREFQMHWNPLK